MRQQQLNQRATIFWIFVACLVALCAVLGFLQYRWIGELTQAQQVQVRADLQSRLELLQRSFNDQMSAVCLSYVPTEHEIERVGRDNAYLDKFRREREGGETTISRIALAIPNGQTLTLLMTNSDGNRFTATDWPPEWDKVRARILSRLKNGPVGDLSRPANVIEIPRFATANSAGAVSHEQEWLIEEINLDVMRTSILPGLLDRYLNEHGKLEYDAEVIDPEDPGVSIYKFGSYMAGPYSVGPIAEGSKPDAEVTLLNVGFGPQTTRPGFGGANSAVPMHQRPPVSLARAPEVPPGMWLLLLRHRGPLDAEVRQVRKRNIALSISLLVLLIILVSSLVQLTRSSERLAELQMNFVAGISHELRTPLTVIRTAVYNVAKFSGQPQQVEKYGLLVEKESEKLGALVDQILRYGGVTAGRVIGQRQPVRVTDLIEESSRNARAALKEAGGTFEQQVAYDLAPVIADREALIHAIQNLMDNAVKHGGRDHGWLRVTARLRGSTQPTVPAVEIKIADRGPGVPKNEQEQIFDPFFRGKRAIEQQVRGTGLGLNLTKRIVEAHGGRISLNSDSHGTEFTVVLPLNGASET